MGALELKCRERGGNLLHYGPFPLRPVCLVYFTYFYIPELLAYNSGFRIFFQNFKPFELKLFLISFEDFSEVLKFDYLFAPNRPFF